jgi:hypothetical protein
VRGVENMYITTETIIQAAAVITALGTIIGIVFVLFQWLQKQKQQDIDIDILKEEQCILTYGILACLKGLKEQGCNGPVTEAVEKIEKHLNRKAHDQI